MAEENLAHISEMMDTFKRSLEDFARKHKKDINQDPAFRQQFQVMCANIGWVCWRRDRRPRAPGPPVLPGPGSWVRGQTTVVLRRVGFSSTGGRGLPASWELRRGSTVVDNRAGSPPRRLPFTFWSPTVDFMSGAHGKHGLSRI